MSAHESLSGVQFVSHKELAAMKLGLAKVSVRHLR